MNKEELERAIGEYQTPFYIFDTDRLAEQIQKIRTALGPKVELCYAMKANPFVIKELEEQVDYFEVCSPGEFHLCERSQLDMRKIVMSGVYKNPKDIEYALDTYGGLITYTVESLTQWELIERYTAAHQIPVQVLLRLTMGNQFGMDEAVIRRIIADRDRSPQIHIEGIQFFAGTQKKAPGKFEREFGMLETFLDELESQYQFTAEKLEYGPGLPICYFEDDENMEDSLLRALAEQLGKLQFCGKITLEMGRFIVAPCGMYVTKVVDLKRNKNQSYCIVDGGIHHLNYFGQMMGMKKPPVVHWGNKTGETEEWTVCGALCTMNDVLIKQAPFTNIEQGDTLVFEKVGAYSVTEGMSLFLSRDLPQVFFYSQREDFRLVRGPIPTEALNTIQETI